MKPVKLYLPDINIECFGFTSKLKSEDIAIYFSNDQQSRFDNIITFRKKIFFFVKESK